MRTRMSIMESALDIFSAKNFANVSVAEITSRIGLSKGAFYWHFKNKQDVLIKIVEEFCVGDSDKYMGFCGTSPESVGSLRGYMKEALARLRSEERWQKLHKLMVRRHEWPEEIQRLVRDILRDAAQRDVRQLETYIAAHQKNGNIRESLSAHKAAVLLVSIFHGVGMSQLAGTLPDEFPECLDILFDALAKEFRGRARGVNGRQSAL